MAAQRYLLFAMASGETSQAYAIASHLHTQGKTVTLILKKDVTRGFFADSTPPFPVRMGATVALLKQYVEEYKPEVIILCNSKAFRDDPEFWNASSSLFPKQLVVSVDSNWLFLPTSNVYPYNRWMDRYYINLPNGVFQAGLLEHGGTFDIPKSIADRLEPVGCIPAYTPITAEEKKKVRESFGLYDAEKLIFCYVSGFGAGSRSWVFDNLLHAVDELQEVKVRILVFGDVTKIDMDSLKRSDIILPPKTNMDAFYAALSASDLVFQHQGLATLEQGISARVPVIANVTTYPEDEYPELHIGEVQPFAHVGTCVLHMKNTPISKIAASIHTYLFDETAIAEMKHCQELQWSNGEEELVKRIEKAYEEKFV
ncbi:MAG: hypothetical protein WAV51_00370 [Microgenomates group bacterium]